MNRRPQRLYHQPPVGPAGWLGVHGDSIYRCALLLSRDPISAEDRTAATLLKAHEAPVACANCGEERAWLIDQLVDGLRENLAAGYEATERLLDEDRLFQVSGEWSDHWEMERAPVDWEPVLADDEHRAAFREALARHLENLPPQAAVAFALRELDGLEPADIRRVLDVSDEELARLLHTARSRLRHSLEFEVIRGPRHVVQDTPKPRKSRLSSLLRSVTNSSSFRATTDHHPVAY